MSHTWRIHTFVSRQMVDLSSDAKYYDIQGLVWVQFSSVSSVYLSSYHKTEIMQTLMQFTRQSVLIAPIILTLVLVTWELSNLAKTASNLFLYFTMGKIFPIPLRLP